MDLKSPYLCGVQGPWGSCAGTTPNEIHCPLYRSLSGWLGLHTSNNLHLHVTARPLLSEHCFRDRWTGLGTQLQQLLNGIVRDP